MSDSFDCGLQAAQELKSTSPDTNVIHGHARSNFPKDRGNLTLFYDLT